MLWILIAITLLTCLFTQLVAQLRDREKIFVLFHCNCHDGLVAGYALWLKYPPWSYHITWIAIQASWTDDTHLLAMCAGHNIIFLDVTINDRVLMESIAKAAGHLTIIDHHKSVEKLLFDLNIAHENKLIVKYSSTQAASVIAWEYYHPGCEPSWMTKMVDVLDRWATKGDPLCALFKDAFCVVLWIPCKQGSVHHPNLMFLWYAVLSCSFTYYPLLLLGKLVQYPILNWVKGKVSIALTGELTIASDKTISVQYTVVQNGFSIPWAFGITDNQKIGQLALAMRRTKGHNKGICMIFVIDLNDPSDKRVSVRFRDEEANVTSLDVAKLFNGGGHISAAGFLVKRSEPMFDPLRHILNELNL